jgi:hypothetical protein
VSVEIAARIRTGRQTAGISIDHIFGTLDLNPTAADYSNYDLVTGREASIGQHSHRKRHLVLSRDLTHCFTILPTCKASR